jgi:hypothetical protein
MKTQVRIPTEQLIREALGKPGGKERLAKALEDADEVLANHARDGAKRRCQHRKDVTTLDKELVQEEQA